MKWMLGSSSWWVLQHHLVDFVAFTPTGDVFLPLLRGNHQGAGKILSVPNHLKNINIRP